MLRVDGKGPLDHGCGYCSCIAVYFTKTCAFCDSAYDMTVEMLQEYGVPESAITKIDVEGRCSCGCADDVQTVPLIRVCNETIDGIPDENQLHDAVLRILMKDCLRA